MKKLFLLFSLILSLNASFFSSKNYHFVVGAPIIDSSVSLIVRDGIIFGYEYSLSDLIYRLNSSGKDIIIKYFGVRYKPANRIIANLLKKDKQASKELEEFIKRMRDKSNKIHTNRISLKSINLKGISFKLSSIKHLSKNFWIDDFKSVENRLKSIYRTKELKLPFYKGNINDIILEYQMLKPHLFFYECFTPLKRGRRYFLNIQIFMISIDKDGKISLLKREIKDFNWRRNYRYIASQTGYVIRDIFKTNLGEDIK